MNKGLYRDMDDMIRECQEKKKDNETMCFAFGAGRILPELGKKKQYEAALDFIKSLEGFCGVHPIDLWHTLLIFDTLNNAKGGRNLIRAKGINVGDFIAPILIETKYLKEGDHSEDIKE